MPDCDVCIGTTNNEPAEFYREFRPKARVSHKCCECGREIPIGATYFRAVGCWDGVINTYRQCLICREIQHVFSCGSGWTFETLWEDLEYVFDRLTVRSPCFNALSMEARAYLTERWWKWKEWEAR